MKNSKDQSINNKLPKKKNWLNLKSFFWAYPIFILVYSIFFIFTGSTYVDMSFTTNGFKKLPVNTYLNIDKTQEINQLDLYDLIQRRKLKEIKIHRLGIFEKNDEIILYVWTSMSSSNLIGDNWWARQKPCHKVIFEKLSKRAVEFSLIAHIFDIYGEKEFDKKWNIADNLIYYQNNDFKLHYVEINIPIETIFFSYMIVLGFIVMLHLVLLIHTKKSSKI